MTLNQKFQLERIPCMWLHDILKRLFAKVCLTLRLCVCFDLLHFVSLLRFMLLNATLWFTVMHTIKRNEPKLAEWYK